MGKWCLHVSLFLGNKDMFKNYKRFDFWQVQTADIGGTKPWKNNCSLIWKLFKFLMTLLAGLFNKVAGNQDRHKSLVEFGPLVSMAHLYVFFKWDLTLAHWTQVYDCCPLGYLFYKFLQSYGPWMISIFRFCSISGVWINVFDQRSRFTNTYNWPYSLAINQTLLTPAT